MLIFSTNSLKFKSRSSLECLLKKFTVLGGNSSRELAKKISKKMKCKYVDTELRIFPDGESKITIKGKLDKKPIIVVQSTYPPVDSNFLRALFMISKAREYSSDVTGVIPYMGYARQDREFLPGEIVTMETIAEMFKAAGASRIIVVDIHSKIALSKFKIRVQNISAVPDLVKYFKKSGLKNLLVVSPDKGGVERAKEFASQLGISFIALDKKRDRKTGEVNITTESLEAVKGKNLILVDDMISTGGSIIKASEFLKKQKCGNIYVSCTHALMIGDARTKIIKSGVKEIISSNSIPGETSVVDISNTIVKAISDA